MLVIDPKKDLTPIGRIASRFGLPGVDGDKLLAVAEQLGLSPARRVDRTVYFDLRQVKAIVAAIQAEHEPPQ